FASRKDGTVRVLLYSHHGLDTESRSEADFEVTLSLTGLPGQKFALREYRFDKDHNSYFRLACSLRDRADADRRPSPEITKKVDEALQGLESEERSVQAASVEQLARLGPEAASASGALGNFMQKTPDEELRGKAFAALRRVSGPRPLAAADVRK